MPRGHFYNIAGYRDSATGIYTVVTTARITVYLAPPYAGALYTTLASVYSSETGPGTPGNSFLATSGAIEFWAEPGSYDIKIEDTATTPAFATKYIRWTCIPGDKGVITEMIEDVGIEASKLADGAVSTSAKIATGAQSPNSKPNGLTIPGPIVVPANNTTDANVSPGFFIRPAPGEVVKIVAIDYKIHSGTSARFSVFRNGAAMTGLTNLTATPSGGALTLGSPITCSVGDYIQLIPNLISGDNPQHLAATVHTYHYPKG